MHGDGRQDYYDLQGLHFIHVTRDISKLENPNQDQDQDQD